MDVAVRGNYAFLADGAEGLEIIDVRNPALPTRINGGGLTTGASRVVLFSNHAYVTTRLGLERVDVTDPMHPLPAGSYSAEGPVDVAGDYAFLADYNGLHVIDVRHATNLVRVGFRERHNFPTDVVVSGNYVYVAELQTGFHIFDVSSPSNPTRVGGYNTSDYVPGHGYYPTADLVVSGSYLYVANGSGGVKVFDISNPTNPIPAGSYAPIIASAISLSGNYAYVTDYYSDLEILRIDLLREDIRLAASVAGDYLVLRWPASAGFVPESTISLSSPQWEPVVGEPEVQGGFARLSLPLNGPTRFFRLVQSR
jgi:hypothetical protein